MLPSIYKRPIYQDTSKSTTPNLCAAYGTRTSAPHNTNLVGLPNTTHLDYKTPR